MSNVILLKKFSVVCVSENLRSPLWCHLIVSVPCSLGGRVNANNLNTVLNNMGVKLSDSELRDLSQSMHVGGEHLIRRQMSLFVPLQYTYIECIICKEENLIFSVGEAVKS